jgi:hypothetical protein
VVAPPLAAELDEMLDPRALRDERALEIPDAAFDRAEPTLDTLEPAFDCAEPAFDRAEPAFDALEPAFDALEPAFDALEPFANKDDLGANGLQYLNGEITHVSMRTLST